MRGVVGASLSVENRLESGLGYTVVEMTFYLFVEKRLQRLKKIVELANIEYYSYSYSCLCLCEEVEGGKKRVQRHEVISDVALKRTGPS